jgi:hypothetical protein
LVIIFVQGGAGGGIIFFAVAIFGALMAFFGWEQIFTDGYDFVIKCTAAYIALNTLAAIITPKKNCKCSNDGNYSYSLRRSRNYAFYGRRGRALGMVYYRFSSFSFDGGRTRAYKRHNKLYNFKNQGFGMIKQVFKIL